MHVPGGSLWITVSSSWFTGIPKIDEPLDKEMILVEITMYSMEKSLSLPKRDTKPWLRQRRRNRDLAWKMTVSYSLTLETTANPVYNTLEKEDLLSFFSLSQLHYWTDKQFRSTHTIRSILPRNLGLFWPQQFHCHILNGIKINLGET